MEQIARKTTFRTSTLCQREMKYFLTYGVVLAAFSFGIGQTVNQLREKPLPLLYMSKEERLTKAVARIQSNEQKDSLSLKL